MIEYLFADEFLNKPERVQTSKPLANAVNHNTINRKEKIFS